MKYYVVRGGYVTKNVKKNDVIDVSDIVVSLHDDIQVRNGTSFKTKIPNTVYYLDFMKGDFTWGTSHPNGVPGENYLTIAEVTTDRYGNVATITDKAEPRGGFRLKDDYGLEDYVKKGSLFVNVIDFGADPERRVDARAAIQAAIDSIKPLKWDTISAPRGGIVYLPPGSYLLSGTLILPAYVRLVGAGMFATELFLANGANADVIKTEGYDNFIGSGLAYYDMSGVPTGFSIESMMIRGNRFNNTSGSGVKIYGYNYTIKDLAIIEVSDTGFVSRHETGNDNVPFIRNKVKLLESYISNLHIHDCNGRGFDYRGPTDAKVDGVFVGVCRGDIGANIRSSIDVGLLHVYSCCETAGGFGVYINGGSRFENLISEHNYGTGVRIEETWYVSITNLQLYRNCRKDTNSSNLSIQNNVQYLQIGNAEIKLEDVDTNGVTLLGKYNKITRLLVTGNGSTTYTKTGVRLDNTSGGCAIMEMIVKGLNGAGAVGLRMNQGGSAGNVTVRGSIEDCTTCINPGSQSGGGSVFDLRTVLSSGQTSVSHAISPKPTDTVYLVERSAAGDWSTLNSHIPV